MILGRLLLTQELTELAADILSRGLTRHGDRPDMHYWLSDALRGDSRPDEAKEVLEAARQLHPRSAWVHLGFACQAMYEERLEEAVAHADAAADLRGHDHEVTTFVGWTLMQLPNRHQAAEELLREAARRDMSHRLAHIWIGALLEEKDPREANAYLGAALQKWPYEVFNHILEEARASIWHDGPQRPPDA